MISKKHRFHGHNSLRYVYQHGETIHTTSCSIKYLKNTKRDSYRLSVVISKKVNKSAVKRNRMRRRIYEVVRKQEDLIKESRDIIITIFSDQFATMPAQELEELITSLLKQAKILKKVI